LDNVYAFSRKLPKGSRKLDVEVKVEERGEKRVTVIDTKDSRAD
jgi:hypothetical protein